MTDATPEDEAVTLPIDGTLDLHTFRPKEIGDLVPAYLEECRKRRILQVRIIHGKGTGALRRSVESLLARHPHVLSFRQADETGGGWGATLAFLSPDEEQHHEK